MPSFIVVQNADRTLEYPTRVRRCESFLCRLRGLMFRSHLGTDDGLLLVMPGESRIDASIHMLFVPFDIAVFWISGSLEVVDKTIAKAWRPALVPARPARYVLELHPSKITSFEVGHKVHIIDG